MSELCPECNILISIEGRPNELGGPSFYSMTREELIETCNDYFRRLSLVGNRNDPQVHLVCGSGRK